MFYLFYALAVLAFVGAAYNGTSPKGTGRGMAYSLLMLCVWAALAYWYR